MGRQIEEILNNDVILQSMLSDMSESIPKSELGMATV